MAISAGQVFVDLGARLDRREFELYERELKKVQERTAKREHFRAELGANFDSRAFNAYERELRKAEHQNDDMVRSNGRLRTSFGSVWSRGGAAFAAAGGAFAVVSAVKGVTKAYGESQVSQEKMRAQLKALGIDYDAHAKQIDAVIQKTSQLSGLDDEDLQDAFTGIVRTTKSVNLGLKDMALVADLARAKHMDVARAGEFLAKIHAGNVGGLRRLGIEFTKSTAEVDRLKANIKDYTPAQLAAAKASDKHADSTRALGLIQRRFGGQAEAYGKTQAGAMDRVKVAFENLQETIGRRLGPTLTRAANGLANFINEMDSGTGKGGKFVDLLQTIGRGFTLFARTVRTVAGGVAGFFDLFMKGIEAVGEAGSHLPGVGGKFRAMADDAREAGRKLSDFKKRMDISVESGKVRDDLERMRKKTGSSLGDMHDTVVDGMRLIRRRLGTDSDEGQRAVHRHFRSMVARIREAMKDGRIETNAGMVEIRKIMLLELKELGIPSALSKGKPLSSTPPKGGNVPVVKAGGGWIGAPGTIGYDTVPAMLAPGEAVLNRHQQGVIESMLGEGFLDHLFATVNRPHFMARGGRARFARGGDTGGRFLQLPENISATHQTAGLAGYPAQDIFASPGTPVGAPVAGVIARLSGQAGGPGGGGAYGYSIYENGSNNRSYFLTHFGSTSVRPGQHVNRGTVIGTVADYPGGVPDHIHEGVHGGLTGITAGGPSGATLVAKAWDAIKAPQTTITGLLGQVVQGTLNRTTSLANRRGRSLAAAASTDPGGAGVVGPIGGSGSGMALMRSIAKSRGWNFQDWWNIDARETGHGANLVNPTSTARLRGQFLSQNWGKYGPGSDPRQNPSMDEQIRSMAQYIAQRYGNPTAAWRHEQQVGWYAKGKPGKPSKLVKTVGGATAGLIRKISPLQKDRSARFDRMIAHTEAWDTDYGRWERRFNTTEEELVDSETGQVDVAAVERKADELRKLLAIRRRIEHELERAQRFAKRIIASYQRIIRALRRSLRHARRKDRAGIQSYVDQYEGRVDEWKGKLGEVGDSLFDTGTDVMELKGELKEVLGTKPQIEALDIPDVSDVASDISDVGGDTGGGDTTPDAVEAPPSPLQIAEAAAAEMRTFLSGRQELLQSFGRNYLTPGGAGAYFSGSDALDASAGARFFGGSSGGGPLSGGSTVIANFASPPDNAPTFVQQMRFLVENGSGG